jgi:hypothetical protein
VLAIKLTVHATGSGVCSLTEKECDGLTVSFDDGTVKESFLSWRAFRQLLGMKAGQQKPMPRPTPAASIAPSANAVAAPK